MVKNVMVAKLRKSYLYWPVSSAYQLMVPASFAFILQIYPLSPSLS